MSKTVKKEKQHKKKNDFFVMLRHVKFSWGFITISLIAMVIRSVVSLMVPEVTAELFNGDFSTNRLLDVVGTMLATFLVTVFASLMQYLAESRSVRSARNYIWEMLMNVKSSYFNDKDPASLLSIVTNDTEMLAKGLVQFLIAMPGMLVLILGSMAAIGQYNPKLLIAVYIMIPVYLVYVIFVGRWQMKLGQDIQSRIGMITGYLAERIRNLAMIKAFATERTEQANGSKKIGELYGVNKQYRYLMGVVNTYQLLTVILGTVLAVLWGSHLLRQGEITMTEWLAFFMYMPAINSAFMAITVIWTFVKDFQGRAFRLARLIEAPKEETTVRHQKNKSVEQMPKGDIHLKEVSFSYKEGESVLDNVSFTIPQGQITAIVGPSGSGKTTVLKLLERLYDLENGCITVDGVDISVLDLNTWRGILSYVVQDAGVFGGTIREAMTYGVCRTVSDFELEEAAKMVGLYAHIEALPKRFDEKLASWGASLSGGQRQRLVLARALLRKADILLFDEPTSALDPDTAADINRLIFENFQGKTIVLISHELDFIAHADQIVVMCDGKVKGLGNHEALMENCSVYRELVQEQSYREVFGK